VYGMMNSPEKTMHSRSLPGSKYAPVKMIEPSAMARPPVPAPAFGKPLGNENAGFQPFVDEDAEEPRPKTPALGSSRPALTPCKICSSSLVGPYLPCTASSFKPFVDGEDEEPELPPPSAITPSTSFKPFVDEEVAPPKEAGQCH
jgi:hypothetical protein